MAINVNVDVQSFRTFFLIKAIVFLRDQVVQGTKTDGQQNDHK